MNKKALSTVIATSLIILITIAAVAIIWTAIIPMIRNNAPASDACMGVTADISILSACVANDGNVTIKVSQGTSDAVIQQLHIIAYNSTQGYDVTQAITLGKNKEASLTTTSKIIGATEVAVAPIVKDGVSSKECGVTAKKAVTACA